MTLNRRTIGDAFKVDATLNIVRKATCNTLTINARSKRTGSNTTGID